MPRVECGIAPGDAMAGLEASRSEVRCPLRREDAGRRRRSPVSPDGPASAERGGSRSAGQGPRFAARALYSTTKL